MGKILLSRQDAPDKKDQFKDINLKLLRQITGINMIPYSITSFKKLSLKVEIVNSFHSICTNHCTLLFISFIVHKRFTIIITIYYLFTNLLF